MLNMKLYREEYIQIGDDVKIYFNGGGTNFAKISIEAPKEVNVKRESMGQAETSRETVKETAKERKVYVVDTRKK